MYQDDYKRWMEADLEDADLKPELARIEENDEEIKERFAVALKFGTAGLRGVLGAGTNRMNIYVVRQATQGLAAVLKVMYLRRMRQVYWQRMESRFGSMMH